MKSKNSKTRSRASVSATKKLVTHNGSFHADDVFACATLSLLLEKKGQKFKVIRTRDEKIIIEGDYVFDVGGAYDEKKNRFDHHHKSFKEKRKNGIPYSSFGLVWKKYGKELCGGEDVKIGIDKILVEQIDATDNGMSVFSPRTSHVFNYDISSIVASYLPVWGEREKIAQFNNAVKFAKHILEKEIKQFSALLKVKKLIKEAYKKSKDKRLLVLNADIPRYLVDVASSEYAKILFIIFRDEKNWKMITVRKKAGTFGNKKNLPKSWAGLRDRELQKVTGVFDAVFCHRGLFIAVAKSKAGILKLATLALEPRT